MLLCILLLGSCRPAVKTAILPLSGSHIESAAETALSQKSSLVGGSIEGGMGQDPYQSMDISGGKLIIKEGYRFGGTESSFSLVNGELIWNSCRISGLDRGSGDYDISFYDFLNGTLQYQAGHNWNQEEELQTLSFGPVTIPFHCENITDITSHIDQKAGFQRLF